MVRQVIKKSLKFILWLKKLVIVNFNLKKYFILHQQQQKLLKLFSIACPYFRSFSHICLLPTKFLMNYEQSSSQFHFLIHNQQHGRRLTKVGIRHRPKFCLNKTWKANFRQKCWQKKLRIVQLFLWDRFHLSIQRWWTLLFFW